MRRSTPTILLLTGVLATTAIACREVTPRVTAVRIVVAAPARTFTQIEFSLETVSGGESLLAATRRPTTAGAPLVGQQDLVVYLDDDRANMDVTCTATAFSGADPVGKGSGTVRLVRQEVVRCQIPLGAADAGATDGGTTDATGRDASPETAPDTSPSDASDGPVDVRAESGQDRFLDLALPDLLPDVGLPI